MMGRLAVWRIIGRDIIAPQPFMIDRAHIIWWSLCFLSVPHDAWPIKRESCITFHSDRCGTRIPLRKHNCSCSESSTILLLKRQMTSRDSIWGRTTLTLRKKAKTHTGQPIESLISTFQIGTSTHLECACCWQENAALQISLAIQFHKRWRHR